MLIKKRDAEIFLAAARGSLKDKSFNIQTQYKILKLQKSIIEEKVIVDELLNKVIEDYCKRDDNNQPIFGENGNYTFREEDLNEILSRIEEINNTDIQVPDIYFSLDELEGLGLTLDELRSFYGFIK